MTTATKQKANEHFADPANFAALFGTELYDKQREMFQAVFTEPRVSVVGANSTGKDFTAAHIVLAWLIKYWGNSKVVITAPTWRQIDDIIFNEIRSAAQNWQLTDFGLGLNVYPGSPRISGANPDHQAYGFATRPPAGSTRQTMPTGVGVTGYHSPHLLVVISEAHACTPDVFINVRRFNPQCVLLTGNPFTLSGEFFDSHHQKRDIYYPITISAYDTPNLTEDAPYDGLPQFPGLVTKRHVDESRKEWPESNPLTDSLFKAGVGAIFPESLDDTIVPLRAAMDATKRDASGVGPHVVACDVARFGRNKTVVVSRRGNRARIVWREQGRDTMTIAGWLGNYIRENRVDVLVVDDAGVGGGVVDRLVELGTGDTQLIAFNGGGMAMDNQRYANATSEAWFRMRLWFLAQKDYMNAEADIENDSALIAQITSRGYTYQSDRRVLIESKQDMDISPDEGDALSMTFAPLPPPDEPQVYEDRVEISRY